MAEEKERTAGDVMSSPVKTLGLDATVWEAADALRKAGVSGAPVVDGRGKPAGVFTLSDLAAYVLSTRGDFRVRQFMTAGVVTVAPETTTSEIVAEMRRNGRTARGRGDAARPAGPGAAARGSPASGAVDEDPEGEEEVKGGSVQRSARSHKLEARRAAEPGLWADLKASVNCQATCAAPSSF